MADKQHNVGDLKRSIAEAIQSVKQLKLDRQDINADIQSVREKMNALGIHKAAFDMAMKYLSWEEDKRTNFDLAYALVREAGGLPMQEDLFQAAERMAADNAGKAEAKGPDAAGMDKVIRSQDDTKTNGKTVHEPTGEHQGSLN